MFHRNHVNDISITWQFTVNSSLMPVVSWEDKSSFVKKLEFNRLGVWEAGSACFEFELLSAGGVQVRMNMNAVKHLARNKCGGLCQMRTEYYSFSSRGNKYRDAH